MSDVVNPGRRLAQMRLDTKMSQSQHNKTIMKIIQEHMPIILAVLALLVVLVGFLDFAAPQTAAEVVVELVKQSPKEHVYTEVAQKLAESRFFFACSNVVLGLTILFCAWSISRRKSSSSPTPVPDKVQR